MTSARAQGDLDLPRITVIGKQSAGMGVYSLNSVND